MPGLDMNGGSLSFLAKNGMCPYLFLFVLTSPKVVLEDTVHYDVQSGGEIYLTKIRGCGIYWVWVLSDKVPTSPPLNAHLDNSH